VLHFVADRPEPALRKALEARALFAAGRGMHAQSLLLFIAAWVIAAGAFSAGLWLALHQKPPEDLSHDIVPHDS